MTHAHHRGIPAVMFLLAGSVAAQTTTTTVQASKDNTLYEDSSGALSNGKGPRCFAGITLATPPLRRRAVLAFAVAGKIPKGSKIASVKLVLTCVQSKALTAQPVTLHALTADWGEGTSVAGCPVGPGCGGGKGAASTTNDATWIHTFYNTKRWANAGGDFSATSSGSTAVSAPGQYTWTSTSSMVADVQSWLDKPGTNFGWLLNASGAAFAFATREDTTTTNRPQLVVAYTPPAATVTSTGTGCKGSGSTVLALGANGRPTVPSTTFALNLTGGPAGSGLFGLGFSLFPNGVPVGGGCLLYVNPSPVLVVFAAPSNRVLPVPIPNQASLLGLEAIWQGAVGDSVTSALVTSNALTTRLGL